MWIAISVEFGPGIILVAPSRSRNSSSVNHFRRLTTSSCMMAMCAAGPPKAVKPSLRKSAATSVRLETCVQVYRETFARMSLCGLIRKCRNYICISLLFLISCGGSVTTPVPSNQSIRYLALGIRIPLAKVSLKMNAGQINWRRCFAEKNIQTEVTIIARTGWTTERTLAGDSSQSAARDL